MKRFLKLNLIIVTVFFSTSVFAADPKIAEALDKLFFNAELNRLMSPADPLWKVMSVALWNIQVGAIDNSKISLLKTNSISDSGEVAQYLIRQGFNYHVLIRLRWCLGYDPNNVSYGVFDLAQLESTMVGQAPAGIPEFARVDSVAGKTDSRGQLILNYEPRIHWLHEAMKSNIDVAVKEADRTPHTMRNLFVNRYYAINSMAEFGVSFEKALIQLQAMQTTIKIKIAEAGDNKVRISEITKIEEAWHKDRDAFLVWGESITKTVIPMAQGRRAWEPLSNAIRKSSPKIADWVRRIEQLNGRTIDALDKAVGTTNASNKYSYDTVAEIEMKRVEHSKVHAKNVEIWKANADFVYYWRTHTWPYIHYHANSEHGPVSEVDRETRKEDVHGIDQAPLDEVYLVGQLHDEGERLFERRLQKPQILALRARLIEMKARHEKYYAKGPQLPADAYPKLKEGFNARFEARNKLLSGWIEFLTDDSFRQEAHEAQGYVGLDLDKSISVEYSAVLEKLRAIGERYHKVMLGGMITGGLATGAACWFLLFN